MDAVPIIAIAALTRLKHRYQVASWIPLLAVTAIGPAYGQNDAALVEQRQLSKGHPIQVNEPSTNVADDAGNDGPLTDDQLVTRHLFDQYINRVGKIPTGQLRAAVDLVAARGHNERRFREFVLAEFQKRCQEKPPDGIKRNLLAVISKWQAIEGGYRWSHELSSGQPQQMVSPNDPKVLYAESAMLKQVIECGYRADRSEVSQFLIAVQKSHHPQGKTFLMNALHVPTSNVDPFTDTSSISPIESLWRDFPVFDDAKFVAAVGLAELRVSAGVEWLISKAAPNDFVDGSLIDIRHRASESGSLRENCQCVLAEVSGLSGDVDTAAWKKWWQENQYVFKPYRVSLNSRWD